MVARMKKPAYGLNDAPRKWWNVVDAKLRSYGCVPTRADRCTYVLYSKSARISTEASVESPKTTLDGGSYTAALDSLLDPYT